MWSERVGVVTCCTTDSAETSELSCTITREEHYPGAAPSGKETVPETGNGPLEGCHSARPRVPRAPQDKSPASVFRGRAVARSKRERSPGVRFRELDKAGGGRKGTGSGRNTRGAGKALPGVASSRASIQQATGTGLEQVDRQGLGGYPRLLNFLVPPLLPSRGSRGGRSAGFRVVLMTGSSPK